MGELRKPVLIVVVVLLVLVVLLELGATQFLHGSTNPQDRIERVESSDSFRNELSAEEKADAIRSVEEYAATNGAPPGLGIPYLALIDGILAYTILLIAVGLIVPDHLEGKLQGIITLVLSFLLLLGDRPHPDRALQADRDGVAVLRATVRDDRLPRGLGKFRHRWRGDRALTGHVAEGGRLDRSPDRPPALPRQQGAGSADPHSLIATIIVGFLHGLVPFPMVSITDALAAIIVGIIAIIWAVIVLVGAVVAVVEALATR